MLFRSPVYYQSLADKNYAEIQDLQAKREFEARKYSDALIQQNFTNNMALHAQAVGDTKLSNDARDMQFKAGMSVADSQLKIVDLQRQQSNLQTQYQYNVDMANATAANEAARFNAQQAFAVEQANVAAQQRRQEQLQSLARDISEAAKAPGDYGKLAALTLANAGWGAPATAIGKGAELRTTESLAPLESQLRTRKDVMAQPERPFTFTPITPERVTAPVIAPLNLSKISFPTAPTFETAVPNVIPSAAGAASATGTAQTKPNDVGTLIPSLVSGLKSGSMSSDVANAKLNAAIFAQTGSDTGYQGGGSSIPAQAKGGVVPRYEDGGVNMQDPMQAYQSGGAIALYNALRSAGSSEQQAADFVNTVIRSDAALQQNTAAAQQAQAPMPQRPAYMPMTDASNDTEAQLLRLGMSNPYMGGGYGAGGTYGQEDAMPAAAGWSPQMPQQFVGYDNEGDAAPAAAGWMPQILQMPQMPQQFTNYGNEEDAAPAVAGWTPQIQQFAQQFAQQPYQAPQFTYNSLPNYIDELRYKNRLRKLFGNKNKFYATGGVANGAYISGERGPELNIPLGDKTIVLNQKQMKAAGIDLKKLMAGGNKPKQFADGGVFDQGWGNVTDPDRTLSMNFLNDALARARAGTPWQSGPLPTPVYASTPGFSPLVMQTLGSLTSMAQGIPTEYFQELAAKYRPSGVRESVTQRTA